MEAELTGQVDVIRLDLLSEGGRAAAGRYGVRAIPSTLVLDGAGNVVLSTFGIPNAGIIRETALSIQTTGDE